jgi:hypothetical protein
MYPHQHAHSRDSRKPPADALSKLLPVLSIFTMGLTVPQVWTGRQQAENGASRRGTPGANEDSL